MTNSKDFYLAILDMNEAEKAKTVQYDQWVNKLPLDYPVNVEMGTMNLSAREATKEYGYQFSNSNQSVFSVRIYDDGFGVDVKLVATVTHDDPNDRTAVFAANEYAMDTVMSEMVDFCAETVRELCAYVSFDVQDFMETTTMPFIQALNFIDMKLLNGYMAAKCLVDPSLNKEFGKSVEQMFGWADDIENLFRF